MFDWDRFKNGEFVVTFGKEEDAKDFLKECDKRGIKWRDGTKATDFENFWNGNSNLYFEFSKLPNGICYGRTNLRATEERMIVKWEVKEMKELTFKEVIANIKEGEVWESLNRTIRMEKGERIVIEDKFSLVVCFDPSVKYKLQRKEYTFEEAFKKLKVGKEIESVITKEKYRIIESEFRFPKGDPGKNIVISYKEIEGKWYIND